MIGNTLEARVAELERQVAELLRTVKSTPGPNDWRSTIGMFSGDELMKQIDEEARKIREADRRRTRPRKLNPRKAKVKK